MALHQYPLTMQWQGNTGLGTASYHSYKRDFVVQHPNKVDIAGSADPAYLGDPSRWNPEDLLVAATSACHQLWYLHLCAEHDICVLSYVDQAVGYMQDTDPVKRGHMTQVILRPHIQLSQGSDLALAQSLHHQAHHECMIANSVNFPVLCEATYECIS